MVTKEENKHNEQQNERRRSATIANYVEDEKSSKNNEEVTTDKTVNEIFCQIDALNEETAGKLEYLIAMCKLNSREFGEAIPYLKAACDKRFHKAYYNYAICLLNGYGVKKNENLVSFFFE